MSDTDTKAPVFRALAALEGPIQENGQTLDLRPVLHKREPFWHPTPVPFVQDVLMPTWSWQHDGMDDVADRTVLDCNGAFMAPLSGTWFAHGALERALDKLDMIDPRRPYAGYYRINTHSWPDRRIVSPLGTGDRVKGDRATRTKPGNLWVTAPTLELLADLVESGHWPEIEIHDAWISTTHTRFSKWASWVSGHRRAAIIAGDEERQEAIKTGYSIAVQLMNTGAKSDKGCHRPDWYHTVHAQHAANMWRKAWNCVPHATLLEMGNVDELVFPAEDVAHLMGISEEPPLKFDQSGVKLGAFKNKYLPRTPATS